MLWDLLWRGPDTLKYTYELVVLKLLCRCCWQHWRLPLKYTYELVVLKLVRFLVLLVSNSLLNTLTN